MSTPPLKPTETGMATSSSEGATDSTGATEANESSENSDAKAEALGKFELPDGKELKESAALKLAAARPIQLVVLAGPIDSGKTTLITSLYELFQWRQVDGYAFAGSNTLPALEERCYLSRRASGRRTAHTQRTPYIGPDPSYLHLRVRSLEGLRPFRDLLFTDVSGEMFEHARDSIDECKELTFLKRADHFLLLLDCAKGIDPNRRWAMFEDSRALLRSIADSQMLGPYCSVNVVWSRFDYFPQAETEGEHADFRADVEKELRDTFGNELPGLTFSKVAARPAKRQELGFGYGVPALLKRWAETPAGRCAPDLFPAGFSGTRESELFGERYFRSVNANEKSG